MRCIEQACYRCALYSHPFSKLFLTHIQGLASLLKDLKQSNIYAHVVESFCELWILQILTQTLMKSTHNYSSCSGSSGQCIIYATFFQEILFSFAHSVPGQSRFHSDRERVGQDYAALQFVGVQPVGARSGCAVAQVKDQEVELIAGRAILVDGS